MDDARYSAFSEENMEIVLFTSTLICGVNEENMKKYGRIRRETLYDGEMDVHRFTMFNENKNPQSRALRYGLGFINNFIMVKNIKM